MYMGEVLAMKQNEHADLIGHFKCVSYEYTYWYTDYTHVGIESSDRLKHVL